MGLKPRWERPAAPRSTSKRILERLIPVALAGGIAGIVIISYGLAFGAIVFSGRLAEHLSLGLGMGLFAATMVAAGTALFSSVPGMVGIVQDVPAILLSLVLAEVLLEVPEADLLPTAIAAIAVTTFSVGLVSLLLGLFKLGNIIRYVPFPVIGGFLGGTGWFLSLGAILLMTGLPKISNPVVLFSPVALIQWLPGLAFALLQLGLMSRYKHPLILPGLIFTLLMAFYLILAATGTSLTQAGDLGLLLGPFSGEGRWQPQQLAALSEARWGLIWSQGKNIGGLLAVTLLALLLNVSSLEVVLQREMNLNQELRAAGLTNLASSLGGGLIGFHGLGISALCYGKLRGHSRWVGLLAALGAALALVFGAELIGLFPRFVLGGLVLSLGLSFLYEWLWQSQRQLPRTDYLIVWAIVATMASLGVLPGVGLGLVVAVATFLINYSRIPVVRRQLSGHTHHSSVSRAPHQQRPLQDMGGQIQVLSLQGFLFFGTANQLLNQVKQQLGDLGSSDLPQFIVIDFRQVTGMDSSVVYSFNKLKQVAQPPLRIVMTGLRPSFQALLVRQGCLMPEDPVYHMEPTLDRGMAWCETQLLDTLSWRRRRYVPLPMQLQKLMADANHITTLMGYLEKQMMPSGDYLFRQGETADHMDFLETGEIETHMTGTTGTVAHDRTYQPGTMLGVTAFFTQSPYLVSAAVTQPSTVYRLSQDRWQALSAEHPATATAFQRLVIQDLSERLLRTSANLTSLLD